MLESPALAWACDRLRTGLPAEAALFMLLVAVAWTCFSGIATAGDNSFIIVKLNSYFPVSGHNLVPSRDIEPLGNQTPAWKTAWNQARQLVRNGRFNEAVEAYEAVMAQKRNIEELQGEYAKLLGHVGQYDKGQPILERLLQTNPDRLDYVFALARVMLAKAHYDRAIELFARIYEKQNGNLAALAGIIRVRLEAGKKKEAFALLGLLQQARPEDGELKKAVAYLGYELGEHDKVRLHVAELAGRKDADLEILLMAARLHERLGLENQARDYWQRIIDLDAGNTEALERLVVVFEKQGKQDQVLTHLHLLLKTRPNDPDLLLRIAGLLLESGQRTAALPYFEGFLVIKPGDRPVLRTLIGIHAALGNKDRTLAVLEQYYTGGPATGNVNLKEAARLYDATGRFREAYPLYRRLLALSPDDPEILTALANDLLAIGQNEGTLAIWKQQPGLAARGTEVLRPIAELLERLGREDDFLEVMELLHDQDSSDDQVTLRLALLTLKRGELRASQAFFDHLAGRGFSSPEFLVHRGRLFEQLGLASQALRDYEELLLLGEQWDEGKLGISRFDLRLTCLRISAMLGRLAAVHQHFAKLTEIGHEIQPGIRMVYADALRDCGAAQAALTEYSRIVDAVSAGPLVQQALTGMAQVYRMAELPYESEQMLRLALARPDESCEALAMMFDLANRTGKTGDDAWIWLVRIGDRAETCGWMVRFFEAEYLASQGKIREASHLGQRILETMELAVTDQAEAGQPASVQVASRLALGRLFYLLGDYPGAIKQLRQVWPVDKTRELEALVYLEASYEALNLYEELRETRDRLALLAVEPGEQLRLASLYGKARRFAGMHGTAKAVFERQPDSVRAELLMALALEQQGDREGALAIFERIVRTCPDCDIAQARIPGLLFQQGLFSEALARCDLLLGIWPDRPDLLQLKARILWARNEWEASIEVYGSYLELTAEALFLKKATELGVPVERPPDQKRWWEWLGFESGQKISLLDMVMDTRATVDSSTAERRGLNAAAAPFFARYRWQKQLSEELAARRSVQRREYFQAVRQYEQLLRDQPLIESLMFDLAGIYSQLDKLGAEATLYETLIERNPDYPGLAEAMQRNRFKRRPRLAAGYGYKKEDGWNDYISMEKEWEEVSVWASPLTRHEMDISFVNLNYRSVVDDRKVKAKRAEISYKVGLFSGLAFEAGGGFEDSETAAGFTSLARCALYGKMGDKFSGRLSYARDVVADTTASLTRGLSRQDTGLGLSLDPLPRLQLGGDYGYVDFSDGNDTLHYKLWASSIVFPDPTFLQLGYSYAFKHSREGSQPGPAGPDGFAPLDHPYWTPKNYWVNEVSLLFKHRLSDDPLARDMPRYYTAEYAFGYDSNGNAIQKIKGHFYLEITDFLILESAASLITSPTYRNKDLFVSAAYRW